MGAGKLDGNADGVKDVEPSEKVEAGKEGLADLRGELETKKLEEGVEGNLAHGKPEIAGDFKRERDELKPEKTMKPGNSVEELKAMAEKYADTKSVLDRLKYLAEGGEITPEQHAEFLEILSKLKPDCWRGIKFISFRIPLINAFTFRLSANSVRKVALNDEMSSISFTHEVTHNIWEKVMTDEQRLIVEKAHDSMSKDERMATHWKKSPRLSYLIQGGNEEEWFCQAFACWLTKVEPYHTNIMQNPKLQPVVELFESLKA